VAFNFYGNTLPFVSIRLNLSGINEAQVFCVFKSSKNKGLTKVLKQDETMGTGNMCSTTYYIKGEWVEGIQREHRCE